MDLSPGIVLPNAVVHTDEYGDWARVPELENELWVSSKGWVWQFDVRCKKWFVPTKNDPKPYSGDVFVGHRGKDLRVHKLMALAFFGPPPSPSHTADHIKKHGGDLVAERSDNRIENLRWASKSEQSLNRNKQKPRRDGRPVLVWRVGTDRDTAQQFQSSLAAAKALGLNAGSVSRAAEGEKQTQTKGWYVKFVESGVLLVQEDEEFREVDGFFISQYGRALDPQTKAFAFTPQVNKGLWCAYIGQADGKGGSLSFAFHELVAKAWPDIVGEDPGGEYTLDHKNRDPSDNYASNLRWATKAEQAQNKNDFLSDHSKTMVKVELKAPNSDLWMQFDSQCAAVRNVNARFGVKLTQQTISDSLKMNSKGRTINKGKHAGWSIRAAC